MSSSLETLSGHPLSSMPAAGGYAPPPAFSSTGGVHGGGSDGDDSLEASQPLASSSYADAYRNVMANMQREMREMDLSASSLQPEPAPPVVWSDRLSDFAALLRRRTPYYVPFLAWLPQYRPRDLLYDIPAGVAVASMLIPQGLVFAGLAGLEPAAGLYTAMLPVLVYALMGNSRQLSVGPEALVSTLVGIAVMNDINADYSPADVACVLAFLSGLVSLALGIFRFGFIDSVLSRPLLGGFINAVALIIVINQLDTLLGLNDYTHGMLHLEKLWTVVVHLGDVRWQTLLLSIAASAFLLGVRMVKSSFTSVQLLQFFPETLLVVVLATLMSWLLEFELHYIRVLGSVSTSFPIPRLPPIYLGDLVAQNIGSATLFAVVGFIESIIAAKHYARKHLYPVSSNRELVALGLANLAGSVLGAYPTFGSLPRSLVADKAGARTQIFSIVAVGIITGSLFFMSRLVYYLPQAVMASIVLVAAVGLFEAEDFIFLLRMGSWREMLLMLLTFVLTVVLGPEYGVLASLGVSVFVLIQRISTPSMTLLGRVGDSDRFRDVTQADDARPIPGVLLLRVECDRIFFANTETLREMLHRIERLGSFVAHPTDKAVDERVHTMVLDMRNVLEIDATGMITFHEWTDEYRRRGVNVYLVRLRHDLHADLVRAGVVDPITGFLSFATITEAVEHSHAYSPYSLSTSTALASAAERATGIGSDIHPPLRRVVVMDHSPHSGEGESD